MTNENSESKSWDAIALYVALVVVMVGIGIMVYHGLSSASTRYGSLRTISQNYYDAHGQDLEFRPDLSMLYSLQASRAEDILFLKCSALLLGYLTIVVGSLFVLTGNQAFYSLKIAGKGTTSALQTSSPGLVLITLGTLLVAITVVTQSTVETKFQWVELGVILNDKSGGERKSSISEEDRKAYDEAVRELDKELQKPSP